MAPPPFDFAFSERGDGTTFSHVISGAKVPTAGDAMSLIIAMSSISVLSIFLFQRMRAIGRWSELPFVVWLTFAIYIDSMAFVVATTILEQIFGVNTGKTVCLGAIWLCLTCYITTKIFIYLFLVEKAHIIRGTPKPRLKSKLYIFNSFGMLGCYSIIAVFNFIFHIAKIDQNGVCIIGMKTMVMIPLISFDAVVNIYLTILFLIPLKNLYSFKNLPKTQANVRLRSVAFRTFVGSCCTLVSSIVNLTILMVLQGEPGWICLLCCNCDVLFSALVIQWVTSKDNAGSSGQTSNGPSAYRNDTNHSRRDPLSSRVGKTMTTGPTSPRGTDSEISLVDIPAAPTSEHGGESDISKSSSLGGGGAVMVTTTIHRQSLPTSGFESVQTSSPLGQDSELYGYTSRSAGYGDDRPEPPRTHITGGRNNHE